MQLVQTLLADLIVLVRKDLLEMVAHAQVNLFNYFDVLNAELIIGVLRFMPNCVNVTYRKYHLL